MRIFDDVVDIPKQPKIRESFIGFLTKRESFYLGVFLTIAVLSTRVPIGLVLNTFLFGLIFFSGFIFTYHQYKGRNFDRWFFDYIMYKLRTIGKTKLVFSKDYKFNFKLTRSLDAVLWKKILFTMPLLGGVFEKVLGNSQPSLSEEIEDKERDVFNTFESYFELDEIEEQIKGILTIHFYYEWQEALKNDKGYEYADASKLLILLDKFIEERVRG